MRMLCIDGGGIRGILAVIVLQALEEELQKPIGESFDGIAGTSTGSIIAASTALGIEMEQVLQNYLQFGEKIFTKQATVGLFKHVYTDRYLRRLLKNSFGEVTLEDIQKPLLIPTVDITHGRPFIYRSNFGNPESKDLSIKLWDAVLSSCSAPVYFPPNNVGNEYLSVDGGLWANNPSLVCITEAVNHFHKHLDEIHILSLGTGLQRIDFSISKGKKWGVNLWLPFHLPTMRVTPKLIDLALHLSSESISYHCQLLLKDRYLRINEDLGEEVSFDEVWSKDILLELGKQLYRKKRDAILRFLDEK
ncbi:CBASS cGAMP-activated phospholipase [Pseudoneobacillus sp. C159]